MIRLPGPAAAGAMVAVAGLATFAAAPTMAVNLREPRYDPEIMQNLRQARQEHDAVAVACLERVLDAHYRDRALNEQDRAACGPFVSRALSPFHPRRSAP